MDFRLSEEQRAVYEMTAKFAGQSLLPGIRKRDDAAVDPQDLRNELYEMGFAGFLLAEEAGGMAMDMTSFVLALEQLAAVDASIAFQIARTNSIICPIMQEYASDYLRTSYLENIAVGEIEVAYVDGTAGKLVATVQDSGWQISGSVSGVVMAESAELVLIHATIDDNSSALFLCKTASAGVIKSKNKQYLGFNCAGMAELTFETLNLKEQDLITLEGDAAVAKTKALIHLADAAICLGMGRGATELARMYAGERKQFGKTIDRFEAIRFKIAEMNLRCESAAALVFRAAAETGPDELKRRAAMAKIVSTESANFCARECVQIHGGYGYSKEYQAERFMRDARLMEIIDGSSEELREFLALGLIGS
jgi:alkylation response protein AidB-like acyl-CoA dehydrogenase